MKKYNLILILFLFAILVIGCTNEEKVVGTVAGNNLATETLQGVISTTANFALTSQRIPLTITLPKTFSDVVTVEVTSFSDTGLRRRAYIDIPANLSTFTGEAIAAGGSGATYQNTNCSMILSAISLKTVEIGKQYSITSNTLTIATGDTSIPTANSNKFLLRFDWMDAPANYLNLLVDRPNNTTYNAVNASSSAKVISVTSTAGLQTGMIVNVISGTGNFVNNTTVESINSATNFTVNVAPSSSLSGATIQAFGNDYTGTSASGLSGTKLVNVSSTANLAIGMVVSVISGSGKFAANTLVTAIVSPTSFNVSTFIPATTPLVGATISGAYPNTIVTPNSSNVIPHDISVNDIRNATDISSPQGDYIFKLKPTIVSSSIINLPYRIVLVLPDGKTTVLNGFYNAITATSPYLNVLKVNKTGLGDNAVFTPTNLNP